MARFRLHGYLPLFALTLVHPASANLLYATFQDHAVLQREAPIPVWGTTAPEPRWTVRDVLIGDVFLCSGQSNMEYPTRLASDYDQDVESANDGRIRLFHVERFRAVATSASALHCWRATLYKAKAWSA